MNPLNKILTNVIIKQSFKEEAIHDLCKYHDIDQLNEYCCVEHTIFEPIYELVDVDTKLYKIMINKDPDLLFNLKLTVHTDAEMYDPIFCFYTCGFNYSSETNYNNTFYIKNLPTTIYDAIPYVALPYFGICAYVRAKSDIPIKKMFIEFDKCYISHKSRIQIALSGNKFDYISHFCDDDSRL